MNKVIGGVILTLIGLFAISKKSSGKQPDIFDINDKPLPGGGGVLPMPDNKNPTDMLDDKWKIPSGNPSTNNTINCLVPPCPQIPGGSTKTAPIVTANAPATKAPITISTDHLKLQTNNPEFISRKQSLIKAIERAGLARDSFESLSRKIMSMNADEVGALETFLRSAAMRSPMSASEGKQFEVVNAKYALFPATLVAQLIKN